MLADAEWLDDVWMDVKALAEMETGIDQGTLPEVCPLAMADVLTEAWLPA